MPSPESRVGRNNPCPCGSGRKFKHCCLGAAASGPPGRPTRVRDEQHFIELITAIDDALKARSVAPRARPLLAVHEFCKLTHEELSLMARGEPRPGCYSGDDLSVRIERWYDAQYGRKLDIQFRVGGVVVLVRGDPWRFELPLILGGGPPFLLTCDAAQPTTVPKTPIAYRAGDPIEHVVFVYNVLDALVDFPPALARSLSAAERRDLLASFALGRAAYEPLRAARQVPLVAAATADLYTSVEQLGDQVRHCGNSKWASLQAVEKLLKAFLAGAGDQAPRVHQLVLLAELAERSGLTPVDRQDLVAVQCAADVRYEAAVTVADAVQAHHAALRLVAHIAPRLSRT